MVNSYKKLFFYSSCNVLVLPPHNTDVIYECFMVCCHMVVMDGGWSLEVLLNILLLMKCLNAMSFTDVLQTFADDFNIGYGYMAFLFSGFFVLFSFLWVFWTSFTYSLL